MKKAVKLFRSEIKEQQYYSCYDKALGQLPVPYNTQYVKTTYGDTHVIRAGSGENPKLILLHCQGFSSIAWYNNLAELSQHFEVFCVDSIGEPNKTICNKTRLRNADYVRWLLEVCNALELKKPNLCGWSFGGFIAAMFALHHPEHVSSLILLSPAGCVAPISSAFFLKLFPALITGKETKINRFLKWISGYDNHDLPNPAFALFTCGMQCFQGWAVGAKLKVCSENDFQKIKAPVLILIGENDPIYKKIRPKQIVAKMNQLHPNIIAETIPGRHGFPIQNADMVNERLISFMMGIL